MDNPEQTGQSPHDSSALGSGVPETSLALLSDRQRSIAWLIAQGQTNHQIGTEVDLDSASVAEEVEEVRRALGVQTRVQLALVVHQHGRGGDTERPVRRGDVAPESERI